MILLGVKIVVDWKQVLIGTVLVVITWIILAMIIGSSGYYAAFFLAAIYVGYKVNSSSTNGAVHGILMGILGGAVISALILSGFSSIFGLSKSPNPSLLVLSIVLFAIFALLGGVMGVNLLKRSN